MRRQEQKRPIVANMKRLAMSSLVGLSSRLKDRPSGWRRGIPGSCLLRLSTVTAFWNLLPLWKPLRRRRRFMAETKRKEARAGCFEERAMSVLDEKLKEAIVSELKRQAANR